MSHLSRIRVKDGRLCHHNFHTISPQFSVGGPAGVGQAPNDRGGFLSNCPLRSARACEPSVPHYDPHPTCSARSLQPQLGAGCPLSTIMGVGERCRCPKREPKELTKTNGGDIRVGLVSGIQVLSPGELPDTYHVNKWDERQSSARRWEVGPLRASLCRKCGDDGFRRTRDRLSGHVFFQLTPATMCPAALNVIMFWWSAAVCDGVCECGWAVRSLCSVHNAPWGPVRCSRIPAVTQRSVRD